MEVSEAPPWPAYCSVCPTVRRHGRASPSGSLAPRQAAIKSCNWAKRNVRTIRIRRVNADGGAFIGGLRYGDGRLSAASKAARAIYRPSMPSDLGDLKYCASFGRGSNFASMPDPMHFIFAV